MCSSDLSFITAPTTSGTYLEWNGSAFVWATPGGGGTVTSVALSLPSIFTVSGSPVTSSGTLTGSLATQSANLVFAGPSSGSAAAPTFRSLVAADIPALSYAPTTGSTSITTLGTITTGTWNGSVLSASYGGTGEAGTLTGILYGNGTSAHTVATNAQLLTLLGTLGVANGGTGLTSSGSSGSYLASNGTNWVTKTPPAFIAYGNAFVTASNATYTKIAYAVSSYDSNSNYNSSNSRFTPNVAGYYQINAQIQCAGSAIGAIAIAIFFNGSQVIQGNYIPLSTIGPCVQVNGIIHLNGSSDYVEIYGYQSSGGNLSIGANAYPITFTGALVRAD